MARRSEPARGFSLLAQLYSNFQNKHLIRDAFSTVIVFTRFFGYRNLEIIEEDHIKKILFLLRPESVFSGCTNLHSLC